MGESLRVGIYSVVEEYVEVAERTTGDNDKLRAASDDDMFPPIRIFTAFSRNSFVCRPCGIPFILTPPSV